jgi:hypothetical protein
VIQPIERMRANRRSSLVLLLLLLLLIGGCSASIIAATGSTAPGAPLPLITSTPSDPTPGTSATFRYTDSSARAGFRCSLDGSPFKPCAPGGVTYNNLPVGAHQFRVEATLGRSTSEAATFDWTVISASSYQPVRIPPATIPLPVGGGPSASTSTSESPVTTVTSNISARASGLTTAPPARSTTAPPASPTTSQPVSTTTTPPSNSIDSPTVSGNLTALLYPGTSQVLDLVFTNPNSSPITVAANGVNIALSTSRAGCPASTNFSVDRGLTTSVTVPANSTDSLAQLGVPTTDWPVIGMTETHTNQDACEGAALTLTYSVTVTG